MTSSNQPPEMSTATVADVALGFPNAIAVLAKYDLDYCCNGNVNFTEACNNSSLNSAEVWKEILQAPAKKEGNPLNFESWNSSVLADFIVQHHHEYVREAIPGIRALLDKICAVHTDTNPELLDCLVLRPCAPSEHRATRPTMFAICSSRKNCSSPVTT